jgi:hypothetical protein
VQRTFNIEINDDSREMRRRPERELKRMFRAIADQLSWGDTTREIQDCDGNVVGRWQMTTVAEEYAG